MPMEYAMYISTAMLIPIWLSVLQGWPAPAEVPVIGVDTFAKLNSPTGVTLSAGARHIDRTPSRCVTTI